MSHPLHYFFIGLRIGSPIFDDTRVGFFTSILQRSLCPSVIGTLKPEHCRAIDHCTYLGLTIRNEINFLTCIMHIIIVLPEFPVNGNFNGSIEMSAGCRYLFDMSNSSELNIKICPQYRSHSD